VIARSALLFRGISYEKKSCVTATGKVEPLPFNSHYLDERCYQKQNSGCCTNVSSLNLLEETSELEFEETEVIQQGHTNTQMAIQILNKNPKAHMWCVGFQLVALKLRYLPQMSWNAFIRLPHLELKLLFLVMLAIKHKPLIPSTGTVVVWPVIISSTATS
jgi:hypothetical protein